MFPAGQRRCSYQPVPASDPFLCLDTRETCMTLRCSWQRQYAVCLHTTRQSMTTSVTKGVRSCSWQDEVDTDAGFLNTQPVSPEFAPIQSAGKGVKGKVSNFQKSLVHSIQWPKLHGRHFKIALALAESFVCSSIHDTTQHHY